MCVFSFLSTHSASTAHYTLSLHDALPIWQDARKLGQPRIVQQILRGVFLLHPRSDGLDQRLVGQAPPHLEGVPAQHLRSEEHTSELQSLRHLVCRLLLEKKNHLSTCTYQS